MTMSENEPPCATCVGRRGPHMTDVQRQAVLDAFHFHLLYEGKDFLCHESRDDTGARTEPCAAFCRFKLSRERRSKLAPPTTEEVTRTQEAS
jgi:hypothetical protein